MYQIGDFSKLTGITVKTLRFYDKEGILIPSYRDDETGYRYYSETNYTTAKLILLLKGFGFKIVEIKDTLNNHFDENDIFAYLYEKSELLKKEISEKQYSLDNIWLFLNEHQDQQISNHSMEAITIEEIHQNRIASIRFYGSYNEIGKKFKQLYETIKNNGYGYPFVIYHNLEAQAKNDIEVCVSVRKDINHHPVHTTIMPAMSSVSVNYIGDYSGLPLAYESLFQFIEINKIENQSLIIETYVKSPGTVLVGDSNSYFTNIRIPIKYNETSNSS